MSSQFFGLEIGYSGLQAYQAALNTTANNISNVETKGYSRQKVDQTAAAALRTYSSYGMAGAGVSVTGISQIRNVYYDIKYHNATTKLGEYATKANYMKQIENYFNDDGETIRGFNTIYDAFYVAMEDWENNPSSDSTRIAFLGAARQLAEYFNSMSENLQSLQEDVNTSVKDTVNQINAVASQIATINKQINVIEIQGTVANELRDKRNNLIDELSKYVDIEIVEDEMCNNNNPDEPLGIYRYQVYISGGQTLVDGYECRQLECASKETLTRTHQSDIEGLYDIRWADTKASYYPVGDNFSGQLKALLQMRDGNNNEYFRARISDFSAETDTDPATISLTVSKNDTDKKIAAAFEYLSDLSKTTLSEQGVITVNATNYKYESWDFTDNGDEVVYTFTLKPDAEQGETPQGIPINLSELARHSGKVAKIGDTVNYQGIPYYMEQMNEWLREFAAKFNDVMMQGSDRYGNTVELALFTATLADGTQVNFDDASKSKKLNYYQLTAANISVNKKMINDVGLLATNYGVGDIDLEDSKLIKDLAKLKYDKSMMSFRGCSSSEFLSCVLGDVALNASAANTFEDNYEKIQKTITNQRLSVSGVDDDEEALDMVKFQNAYNLSAKMIQIMTEIYDRLILETGV